MSLRSPFWVSLRLFMATLLFGCLALASYWAEARTAFGVLIVITLVLEIAFWRDLFGRRKRAVIDTRPPSERHTPLESSDSTR